MKLPIKYKKTKENSKAAKITLWAVSFVLAFILWLSASAANENALEQSYDLIPIKYDSSSIRQYNLVVQSISIDTVNVSIMGSSRDLKNVGASDIAASVSLEKINTPGEYELPVMINTPDNTTLISQTVNSVIVKVDAPTEKSYPITFDSLELVGWSLDSGCYFGNSAISATRVTVYGPTLEIDTIKKVKIRTASIGHATDNMTVAAEVVLLNEYGDVIESPNLSIEINSDILTVKLSVIMEKTVNLTVSGKYGYFDKNNISVSPSTIVISGSPDALKDISEIKLAELDETKELTDRTFIKDIPLPAGVTKAETSDGEAITSAEISVKVSRIKEQSVTLTPDDIKVYSPSDMVVLSSVTIRVRLASSADSDILLRLTPADIIASVNAANASDGDELPLVLSVSETLKDKIYILDIDYKAKVGDKPEEIFPIERPSGGDGFVIA